MEILGSVKTSRAAYNGPKQQCYPTSIDLFCDVAEYFIAWQEILYFDIKLHFQIADVVLIKIKMTPGN